MSGALERGTHMHEAIDEVFALYNTTVEHLRPATQLQPGDAFVFVQDGPRFGRRVHYVRRVSPMYDGRRSCLTIDMLAPDQQRIVETFDASDLVVVGFTNRRAKHRRSNARRAARKEQARQAALAEFRAALERVFAETNAALERVFAETKAAPT